MKKTLDIMRAAVAVLAVAAVVQACVRLNGGGESVLEGLYDEYAGQEGLRVALVRDKGVDGVDGDSVYVDMLMLTAKDSAAWCRLQEAFRAPEPMEAMQRSEDIVTVGRYRGGDEATDMRVVSYLNRTVSIIHAASADDMHAVLYANMENNIRNRTI